MKRIEEIKVKRSNLFIRKRLTVGRKLRDAADEKLVLKHPEMIRNPAAKHRVPITITEEEVKDEPVMMEEA